jgi:hypothetical protein
MTDQELVVEPGPAHAAMVARTGVQRLLRRGEGVEQPESGLAVDVLVVPREQELDRDGDPSRRRDQRRVHHEPATEDGGGDPRLDRRQRYPDRGAQRDAPAVAGADRRDAPGVARRHRLVEVGAGLLVLCRADAVAMAGRIDGDDPEPPGGHDVVSAGHERRRLLAQAQSAESA